MKGRNILRCDKYRSSPWVEGDGSVPTAFNKSLFIAALLHELASLTENQRHSLLNTIQDPGGGGEAGDLLSLLLQATDHTSGTGPAGGGGGGMYVRPYEQTLMHYPHYRLHKTLLLYVPPVLLVLGAVGNVLTFLVLTRRSMRRVSMYAYLAALSVTDTLVLGLGLLRLWVGELTGWDIRDSAVWACRAVNALGYTVSDYSVWLIVAVSVERYIAVVHPLRAPTWCSRTRAMCVMVGLAVTMFAINFHVFFTLHVATNRYGAEEVSECEAAPQYVVLHEVYWVWVDAAIYCLLPFLTLCILNGIIIICVMRARMARARMSQTPGTAHARGGRRHPVGEHASTRLTMMLLAVSVTFLVTTLPMIVYIMLSIQWNNSATKDGTADLELYSRGTLLRTVCELLMYTNHSLNFFLYCATGHKFRQQLCQLCSRCRSRDPPARSLNTTCTQVHSATPQLPHRQEAGGGARGVASRNGDRPTTNNYTSLKYSAVHTGNLPESVT